MIDTCLSSLSNKVLGVRVLRRMFSSCPGENFWRGSADGWMVGMSWGSCILI